MLTRILESDPDIEVVGVAADPYIAVERIRWNPPDVITLDVEMPRMDGLTFLEKIMSQHPIPTGICCTLTEAGSDIALQALERGAVEIITKPKLGARNFSRSRAFASAKQSNPRPAHGFANFA
jgi:two-component system chemotaxis response regulator CheB